MRGFETTGSAREYARDIGGGGPGQVGSTEKAGWGRLGQAEEFREREREREDGKAFARAVGGRSNTIFLFFSSYVVGSPLHEQTIF
jgi:hypothetical protein